MSLAKTRLLGIIKSAIFSAREKVHFKDLYVTLGSGDDQLEDQLANSSSNHTDQNESGSEESVDVEIDSVELGLNGSYPGKFCFRCWKS